MNQTVLNQAVATVTGETIRRIKRIGFNWADPRYPNHDPEASELDRYLDWDQVDSDRNIQFPPRTILGGYTLHQGAN